MNHLHRLYTTISIVLIASSLSFGYSDGPPDGVAGQPGGGTCVQCHDSFGLNSGDGSLGIVDLPDDYTPGETYRFTLQLSDPDASRWGFEMTALDEGNDPAGVFETVDDRLTQISGGGNRPQYVKHRSEGTHPNERNSVQWEIDWNAPQEDIGGVTFYMAGNAANFNRNPSGDRIYAVQIPLQPAEEPEPDQFTLRLDAGWNFVSSPVIPDNPDLYTLFDAVIQDEKLILIRNRIGETFDPTLDFNELTEWDAQSAYQVKMVDAGQVMFSGAPADPGEAIALGDSLNWVPYTRTDTLHPAEAFVPLEEFFYHIRGPEGRFYNATYGFNSMDWLEPGEAFHVELLDVDEFVWPEPQGGMEAPVDPPELRHFDAPVNTGRNMSLLLLEWNDFEPQPGDEVAIINGEGTVCAAHVVVEGEIPLVAWGDDDTTPDAVEGLMEGEVKNYRYWSAELDSVIEMEATCLIRCDDFTYHSDTFLPIALAPKAPPESVRGLDGAQPVTLELTGIYPNPFNSTAEVEFILPLEGSVRLSLLNSAGRELMNLVEGSLPAGQHRFGFQAGQLPAGVYWVSLESRGVRSMRRAVLLR